MICKSWWTHEWLSRVFATLELIANTNDDICIGSTPDEQLVLERFPISLNADHSLQEPLLKSREVAEEFAELMERKHDEESEIVLDEEKADQADAASA